MRWILILGIILIVIGVAGLAFFNYYSFSPSEPGNTRFPMRGPFGGTDSGRVQSGDFASNGEQIFFTGVSSRDTITSTGGPFWFEMRGGGCAACHGPDGKGGAVVMMGRLDAPNITYKALTSNGGKDEHEPFTDESIKGAITRGLEPDGKRLSEDMPRWKMSERDLDDLIDYLKTLD